MFKYVIFVIFLIMLIVSIYLIYVSSLNNNLNKKKQQIGEGIYKNKYQCYSRFSTLCTTVMGGLLVFAFVYKSPTDGVISSFENDADYNRLVNESKVEISQKDIEKAVEIDKLGNFNKTIETEDEVIVSTEEEIVKYSIESKEIEKVEYDEACLNNGLLLYDNNIISYNIISNNAINKVSSIYLYNIETLELIERINVNAEVISASINGENLDIITYSDIKNRLTYDFINESKKDQLTYEEMNYVIGSINKNVMCHTKINLSDFSVKQYALCLSDLYYQFGTKNILCTNIINKHSLNTSLILDYNLKNMSITETNVLGGTVYYNPIVEKDNIFINSHLKDEDYIIYKLNNNLEKVEIVDEKMRENIKDFYKAEEHYISFVDNEIKRYDLLNDKIETIDLPIDLYNHKIIDYHYNENNIFIIAQAEEQIVSIKMNLQNEDVQYHIHERDSQVFISEKHLITIGENGIFEAQKIEEIGN